MPSTRRTSVLTDAERRAIRLHHFIFHILTPGEPPVFLDEVALEPAQRRFFEKQIGEAAFGTQYAFMDPNGTARTRIREMCERPAERFVAASKELAEWFADLHSMRTSQGVFVVGVFSVDDTDTRLAAMLKMDNRKVFQFLLRERLRGGTTIVSAQMTEVLNSFVEDKTTIQKAAIVDPSDTYEWDVLAHQRDTPEGTAQYFQEFLDVEPMRTPIQLTRATASTVFKWAVEHKDLLAPGRHPPDYRSRAIEFMENNAQISVDDLIRRVAEDPDIGRQADLARTLREAMVETGLAGQSFSPHTDVLRRKERQTKLRTAEDVEIIWTSTRDQAHVEIPDERGDDGLFRIVVKTRDMKIGG